MDKIADRLGNMRLVHVALFCSPLADTRKGSTREMECVTMFREDYLTICENGRKKLDFFRSRPFGYFLSAMLAGMFIALGSFAAMCIGGFATAAGSTAVKFLVSLVFAAALSLVIAAGCELFTGNNLVLGAASLNRTVSWRDTALLWFVCYVGNLLGSWVLILIFQATGITGNEAIASFFVTTAQSKIGQGALALFARGILCNICVCLAVWCSVRLKNEAARLIMVVWCILIFMICGFEHSIANMTIIGTALLNTTQDVTLSGYVWNLFFVTLGNMVGGTVFVALPYHLVAQEGQKVG